MKAIALSLLFGLITNSALAGTPTFWNQKSLGFELIESTHTPDLEICNIESQCIRFKFIEQKDKVRSYQESSGACKLSTELVNHDHADGTENPNEPSMMTLSYQIVRVQNDSNKCTLLNERNDKRSVRGIYVSGSL